MAFHSIDTQSTYLNKWHFYALFLSLALGVESVLVFGLREGWEYARLVAFYIFFVALTFCLISYCSTFFSKTLWVYLLSFLICFSVFELKIAFIEEVLLLPLQVLSIAFILSFLISSVILGKLVWKVSPSLGYYALPFAIFVCAPAVMQNAVSAKSTKMPSLDANESAVMSDLLRFKFKQKPNFYLLSFDSMIPEYVAKKHLEINFVPYAVPITKHFVDLAPAFTSYGSTKKSLNAVMRLDQRGMRKGLEYFSGLKDSPVSSIFRENGYEVTTGYKGYLFGPKGKWVDRYIVSLDKPLESTLLCMEGGDSWLVKYRAFRACKRLGEFKSLDDLFSKVFRGDQTLHAEESQKGDDDWVDTVLGEIGTSASSDPPKFKFFYVYRPVGHTPKDYQHTNSSHREAYREYFDRGATMLSAVLEKIAESARRLDPNSIVMVFGDHGVHLSRHIDLEDDSEFYIEDRHIVQTAILDSDNPCATREAASRFYNGYYTPSRIVASVISCLTGTEEIVGDFDFDEPGELVAHVKR